MFISKKDLDNLENKMLTVMDGIIKEIKEEIELLKAEKTRQKNKKVVE